MIKDGTIKWQVPLDDVPATHCNPGMPAIGGPILTASGLLFIAASRDDHLRAFDSATGTVQWEVRPAGGQATAMTYAVAAVSMWSSPGRYKGDSTRGQYLVPYALPP